MPQARHYVDEGSDEGGAVRCHAARYSETDDPRKSDMEARAGIEPAYTDLQSAASPLRHRASPAISRELGCYLRNRRDRKGVLWGKGVSVRVDLGGGPTNNKK